ncbi:hypothetical protein KY361_04170 [Candidatus Woesearchaeota archaeon]|nr:hypothetical protein [Candidatus Woesearchaeota archaeon]
MNKVNSPYIDIGTGIGKDAYISLMNILVSLFIAFVLGYRLSAFLINRFHRLKEKASKKK